MEVCISGLSKKVIVDLCQEYNKGRLKQHALRLDKNGDQHKSMMTERNLEHRIRSNFVAVESKIEKVPRGIENNISNRMFYW